MTQDNHAQSPAPQSRTQQLAALKAEFQALCRQPGTPVRGTPATNRLLRRIEALEGSFVLYQARRSRLSRSTR